MRSKILLGIVLLTSACLETDQPLSFDAQLRKDVAAIDEYLLDNPGNPTDIILRDASGIRLVITTMGTGEIPPNPSNNLKVAYTGKFLSTGGIFDSNDNFILKLSDQVIVGWKIGISLLTKGAEAKLFIPSGYGYGASGNASIPGNANLVFDINLIDVVPNTQQVSQLTTDIAAIDSYLASNSIANAVSHSSGIRYVITQMGTGATPTLYNTVKVNFVAKSLTTGEIAFQKLLEPTADFSSRVVNYPHGALIGLQLLPVGSKATLYTPSVLANGIPGLASGSNAIFEIELMEVVN
jgi:FKBP-type peptidyl-prolyl cis-trans isomerase FkpA